MFSRVLVPVDLSQSNIEAVGVAGELARLGGGEIILLHVIETIEDVEWQEIEEFYRGIQARARSLLNELKLSLEAPPGGVREELVYGRRVREILAAVERLGCDLVVLHSHRVDAENPTVGIGTLSHEVAVLAPCPVLLVK